MGKVGKNLIATLSSIRIDLRQIWNLCHKVQVTSTSFHSTWNLLKIFRFWVKIASIKISELLWKKELINSTQLTSLRQTNLFYQLTSDLRKKCWTTCCCILRKIRNLQVWMDLWANRIQEQLCKKILSLLILTRLIQKKPPLSTIKWWII